jgi:argininosuccinate lyase
MDIGSAVAGALPTALLGYLGHKLAVDRDRNKDKLELSRSAADELLASLRVLRDLVRDSEWDELHPRKWAEANTTFGRVWDDHLHRFPDRWRHLHRSVRSAVGEHVGGVVLAREDKRVVDYPISEFNAEWHQNALEYIGYVIFRLQQWRDEPKRNPTRANLRTFDDWLAVRAIPSTHEGRS